MNERRIFWLSVEGETEQWYLEWLAAELKREKPANGISIKPKVERNPMSYAKSAIPLGQTVWHVCDVEEDASQFESTLGLLKNARKKIEDYRLAYSNLSFDLWMILHKLRCNGFCSARDYLTLTNKAFGENFQSMREYKEERHFKRCLSRLSLSDVKFATRNAEEIMAANEATKNAKNTSGFKIFPENPALTVHEAISEILRHQSSVH